MDRDDDYTGPDFLGLRYRKNPRWAAVGWILAVLLLAAALFAYLSG
ncbi:MAG: hypothetical protein ACE5HP_12585 [Gemmatimonadota bacterium]